MLGYNPAIEVTTGEVAQYFCDVNSQKLSAIQFGNGKEIKGIGYGVGETTEDENGYAKQHRKELLCSTKLDGGSHNKTTADGKEKACQRTFIKPRLHNGHIGRQDVGLGIGCCKCRDATGDNVAYKDKEKHVPVALDTNKACCSGIELKLVVDDGKEAEGKQDSTCDTAYTKIDNATERDIESCKDG